jgi:hypothetical protein
MAARTDSRQIVYSNHEFENMRPWPVTAAPFFVRQRRFRFMTPFAWLLVCAAVVVVMGTALAFTV